MPTPPQTEFDAAAPLRRRCPKSMKSTQFEKTAGLISFWMRGRVVGRRVGGGGWGDLSQTGRHPRHQHGHETRQSSAGGGRGDPGGEHVRHSPMLDHMDRMDHMDHMDRGSYGSGTGIGRRGRGVGWGRGPGVGSYGSGTGIGRHCRDWSSSARMDTDETFADISPHRGQCR